jgi:hypothetical protein
MSATVERKPWHRAAAFFIGLIVNASGLLLIEAMAFFFGLRSFTENMSSQLSLTELARWIWSPLSMALEGGNIRGLPSLSYCLVSLISMGTLFALILPFHRLVRQPHLEESTEPNKSE